MCIHEHNVYVRVCSYNMFNMIIHSIFTIQYIQYSFNSNLFYPSIGMMPGAAGFGAQGGPPNPYSQPDWNRMGPGSSCPSPSLQQGPPPPYGTQLQPGSASKKLHKAGLPEKFDKKQGNSSANSPGYHAADGGGGGGGANFDMFGKSAGVASAGLQTTPSPQLMNYIEFEGQELVITKQLNLSYKGPGDGESGMEQKFNPAGPPPHSQNSTILNCLNNDNPLSSNSPSGNLGNPADSDPFYGEDGHPNSAKKSKQHHNGPHNDLYNSNLTFFWLSINLNGQVSHLLR